VEVVACTGTRTCLRRLALSRPLVRHRGHDGGIVAGDDQGDQAGQRATKDGVIVIEAGRFRTQEQNRADARARLTALVAKAAEPPPKPRKKTRPTKGSVERRLQSKAGRSTVKKLRGKVEND
jgi:hypothetical protein